MERQTIRIRRVGSVTFGVVLVLTGILFLTHLFLPALNYMMIYRFWPVMLILLGLEVLMGSRQKNFEVLDGQGRVIEQSKTIYDVPAVLLTIMVIGFSMIMAAVDFAYSVHHIII